MVASQAMPLCSLNASKITSLYPLSHIYSNVLCLSPRPSSSSGHHSKTSLSTTASYPLDNHSLSSVLAHRADSLESRSPTRRSPKRARQGWAAEQKTSQHSGTENRSPLESVRGCRRHCRRRGRPCSGCPCCSRR